MDYKSKPVRYLRRSAGEIVNPADLHELRRFLFARIDNTCFDVLKTVPSFAENEIFYRCRVAILKIDQRYLRRSAGENC